jgi:hypothetical protein
MAALSHRKPASADISRDTCDAEESDKRNALYFLVFDGKI